MPEFSYRAAAANGSLAAGRIAAPNREHAVRELRGKGLTPIELTAAGEGAAQMVEPQAPARRRAALFGARGPNAADVHSFTGSLAVMLRAGLPLDRSLRVLAEMSERLPMVALLRELLDAVKSGKTFSQALTPNRTLFGDFYINMVRSGEAGGQLAEVLGRLAEHLERVRVLRESVISALIYPAILVVVAAISVFLMLGFVVPQFESLFSDMGEALPLPTRFIVAAGHLVGDWGWLMALAAAAVVVALRRWVATPGGREWMDSRLLDLPVLGQIVLKYEVTRFSRSMGTLLGNGVPIVAAMNIASDTMGNRRLREAMTHVPAAIKQGGRLAQALAATKLFTPLALNMVRLGEETGRLDQMLLELAGVYDLEVQSGVKRAITLIEPALILVLGVVIAGIIVSILMGILSVNDLAA